jgi:cellulose biosynthesis protein BcsQ
MGYKVPVLSSSATKGGVGKSTLNTKCAEYSCLKLGLRVAYLDLDYQSNGIELWFGSDAIEYNKADLKLVPANPNHTSNMEKYGENIRERSSIFDIWENIRPVPYKTPLSKAGVYQGCVDLFPCGQEQFLHAEAVIAGNSREADRLTNFIQDELSKEYDLIILDLGPTRSVIGDAAVRALTHTSLVIIPEPCSDNYLPELMGRMEQENERRGEHRSHIDFVGFSINRFEGTRIHNKHLNAILKDYGQDQVLPLVKKRTWLCEEKDFTNPLKSFRLFKEREVKKLKDIREEWGAYMEALFSKVFDVGVK